MIIDYIEIPKVISKEKYLIDKAVFDFEYFVEIKGNSAYLFKQKKDNKFFWNIFDIVNRVKRKYGDNTIFMFLEKNKNGDIDIILANTILEEHTNIAKYKIYAKNFNSDLKKFDKLLSLLEFSVDSKSNLILFNINLSEKEVKKIIKNRKFEEIKKVDKFLFFVPVKEKLFDKFLPFAVAILIYLVLSFVGDFVLNKQNQRINSTFSQIKTDFVKKINMQNKKIKGLKNSIRDIQYYTKKENSIYKGKDNDSK